MKLRNVFITLLALVFLAPTIVGSASVLVKTDKYELHQHVNKIGGATIVCTYIVNPEFYRELATAISCVVIDARTVVIEQDVVKEKASGANDPSLF